VIGDRILWLPSGSGPRPDCGIWPVTNIVWCSTAGLDDSYLVHFLTPPPWRPPRLTASRMASSRCQYN
jgi:hypothetical protein